MPGEHKLARHPPSLAGCFHGFAVAGSCFLFTIKHMRHVLFLLHPETEADTAAACAAACASLRGNGVTAAVVAGADTRAVFAENAAEGHDVPVRTVRELCGGTDPAELLVVCDVPEAAAALNREGIPAIGLQHAGNADARFSGVKYIFSEPEEVPFDSYVKAWQRARGLPWDILETRRLRVRETTEDDLDALYAIYAMPDMTRYMEGLFPEKEDEARYLRDYIRNVYGLLGFGVWTVIEKESGDIVGRCGFSVREGFELVELGFLIGTRWQGQGYAKEVCRAVLRFGRDELGLDRVQALVKEGNTVSYHLLETLGFQREAVVEAEEDIYGKYYRNNGKAGAHRTPVTPARKGRFIQFLLDYTISGSG